ncbi:hypothetical protein B7463_g12020, partial [Scytalidium lignicola]
MNQDLKTNILVDNNNEQQAKEGSDEDSEEESEERFKEGSEESSEDSFKEDSGKYQTIKEINIQEGILKEVVILPK